MSSKTSRWGSLLQGAVAGLEKGLDNILAEDNAAAAAAARQKQKVASATLQNGVNAEAQQSDLALPKTGKSPFDGLLGSVCELSGSKHVRRSGEEVLPSWNEVQSRHQRRADRESRRRPYGKLYVFTDGHNSHDPGSESHIRNRGTPPGQHRCHDGHGPGNGLHHYRRRILNQDRRFSHKRRSTGCKLHG